MANETANQTVVQASQNTGQLPIDPVVAAVVILMTGIIGVATYLYLNDKQYNYMTRLVSWIAHKVQGEDNNRGFDEEELEEEIEKVAEENEEVKDPEDLFATVEAIAENKEYIGRQEERKKQRKDENLKDILTVVLITSGANLLLRLFEMFA